MESKAMGWRLFAVVVLLHFIAFTVIVKETYIVRVLERERASHLEFFGPEVAEAAENAARDRYTRWFVNSGVMSKSFETMIPTEQQRLNSRGIEDMGEGVFPWVEQRLRALWTLVYGVLTRLAYVALWWPFALVALGPFIVDAIVLRRIKAQSFGITSPHLQGIAARAIPLIALGYFLLMFTPVYIHPAWTPILIFITSASVWLAVSQFVKRG